MRKQFLDVLQKEVARIDTAKTAKRTEKIIEGFTREISPKALIDGKEVRIFNSNDYLGLRFSPVLHEAEVAASEKYGTGPGAVRFISGTLRIHRDLEQSIAQFHKQDEAMVFSSAFAANLAVLFCMLKGQSKDSLVSDDVLVVSDALNHRSIIDGIRLAGLQSEQKQIFKHMDAQDLARVLKAHEGKFKRVVVVTDGVFSMLGEYQQLKRVRDVVDEFDKKYQEGVSLIVDDCHGVAACGETGRGTSELFDIVPDITVGTLGKGFGADGGYVVGNHTVINYLRESAATYIYSNSISPGTAGAARAAVELVDGPEGKRLLSNLSENIRLFKKEMKQAGFVFAADSSHPIQPILIGDAAKTKALTEGLFEEGILVTNINYPVVPPGRDEIRVQISAAHQTSDIEYFVGKATTVARKLGII
ncbi:MAG: aminotransferase class I/II-fold pyridoxal phosphate-dependent enzyme [Candidatus Roizmanbacteria bacterium]|nr:aminotransferase class I/II-fold pyridoxal phosphate-dependent enzyme [Candidatus Roizmanbacteria bacterium]